MNAILEAIYSTNKDLVNKDEFMTKRRELIDELFKKNFTIDLNLQNYHNLDTVARFSKIEGLDKVAKEMACEKDFSERKKYENSIYNIKYRNKVFSWLKDNILKYTKDRKVRIGYLPSNQLCIEYLNSDDLTKPYIKFIFNSRSGKYELKSFHDGKHLGEKSGFSDRRSYLIGPRKKMEELKKQKKEKENEFKSVETYFGY